jgi:hypothetical protein
MAQISLIVAAAVALFAPALAAQARTAEQRQASIAAHQHEYDYLIGDWEFRATNKDYGPFTGLWSALSIDNGGILDEYRIVDDSGATIYMTTTIRNWNASLDQWELIGIHPGSGLRDFGTGHMVGGEMRIEQTFGVTFGIPSILRIRYYNIRPDAFSWTADRSTDGGKTWVMGWQTIEARRSGPSRSLGRLTPARK